MKFKHKLKNFLFYSRELYYRKILRKPRMYYSNKFNISLFKNLNESVDNLELFTKINKKRDFLRIFQNKINNSRLKKRGVFEQVGVKPVSE